MEYTMREMRLILERDTALSRAEAAEIERDALRTGVHLLAARNDDLAGRLRSDSAFDKMRIVRAVTEQRDDAFYAQKLRGLEERNESLASINCDLEMENDRLRGDLDLALAVAQDMRDGLDGRLRAEYARGLSNGRDIQSRPTDDTPTGVPCIDMP